MIKKALENLNIAALNEMQHAALNVPQHADMVLLSPTGSGKTLGFLLPVLSLLDSGKAGVQVLVLVPSRELALQIEKVFKAMGTGFKVNCCYGGHATRIEKNSLSQPPAVLIGTPGRLAYHIRNESFDASTVHTLILDEFDKALEFGFQEDMAYIIRGLTGVKKRILTSATKMDEIPAFTAVKHAVELNYLKDLVTKPDLKIKAVIADAEDKLSALFALICKIGDKATLVFCNHREAVDRISELLSYMGLSHGVFHGGMEQEDREHALLKFRNGSNRLLITTDLASRGLDIPEIECVIHYQLPHNEEAFTHRNGRTARMHAKGTAYLLLTEEENLPYLQQKPEVETLPEKNIIPKPTPWATLYIAAGKKDKVNKVDIVGLLLQKGGLQKDELGLIEVRDHESYAAVKRNRIEQAVALIRNEKIKNKKVKIEVSK
ncbi:DEAD/DEAH box helicase [Mucilaginibacter paludis]|uniref:DEAD/DEAH box helicase domain protein n=1 Tax=Mucilaginibacter paludis DSM 18603 TaxID=714943 RepID=H1Y1R0_9SPHI|nr:DEAD/DEAH box helicase [Mucilaginibacter paludis]EHQ24719.1 DEAD/DEAH box helicase domain protein [Mucilaginibacter paludis DSM 18603]